MVDRDPEAAPFAVALGDVYPAERLRSVTVPTQGGESGRLGFRCVPEDSVHPGSHRTRITDHSQDGQSPATERVREQIDQGLDFIPSALRDGLHDPRLEPTNRPPDLLPIDGVPVGRRPGSRTSKHFCRRHLCLSPQEHSKRIGALERDFPCPDRPPIIVVSRHSRNKRSESWQSAHRAEGRGQKTSLSNHAIGSPRSGSRSKMSNRRSTPNAATRTSFVPPRTSRRGSVPSAN